MKNIRKSIMLLFSLGILSCNSDSYTDIILDKRPNNVSCIAGEALPVEGISIEAKAMELPASMQNGSVTVLKQNLQADDSWFVVKQKGIIYKLSEFSSEANLSVYLDLQAQVFDDTSNEQGMVGLAFHPDFENIPQAFVYYTAASVSSLSGAEVRLSRFTEVAGILDPTSEEIIIRHDKDANYHHSGTLEIGPDGYLYISVGDDVVNGLWNQSDNAQDPFVRKGKLLRVDISEATAYSIPANNPFASGEQGAPEVFALGLRNPWKYSFDSETNALWLGDVGRVGAEEINKIEMANNYGWPLIEGHRCYAGNNCDSFVKPYVSFSRSDKNCIIGGYVYRGSSIDGLNGQYLSGDCVNGSIWMSDVYGEKLSNKNVNNSVLLDTQENITTFAEDENKELYFSAVSGNIYKIMPLNGPVNTSNYSVKEKLSETTCVNMDSPNRPSNTTVAYKIRFPFWSDNAEKTRFVALPNESVITEFVKEYGNYYQPYTYVLPVGSVLIKNFNVEGKIIETRLLAHHSEGVWKGYSYEWNDDQSEAYLLEDSKYKMLENGDEYYFPSRGDCLTCHSGAAHKVLGFNPYQLNLSLTSENKKEHQINYLRRLGIVNTPLDIEVEKFANIHEKNTADWVNAYLHSNCAFCHQEGASLDLGMDFRFTKSLNHLNNKMPLIDDFSVSNAKIITPNDPERSILLNRIIRKDEERMPFIGNLLEDEQAIKKVTAYINSL